MHNTITLENGIRILTLAQPGARTAALGIFVDAGSRNETETAQGAAHFLEHMMFKGTQTRDAISIAQETDLMGGQLNAYTTREHTCYYVRCLDSHLPRATELLLDMLLNSKLDQGDLEMERGVILEEIGMYEDSPDEVCADRLVEAVFGDSPLAHPVLGTAETLEKMTGEWLKQWKDSHYVPSSMVVSLVGSFQEETVNRIAELLGTIPKGTMPETGVTTYTPAFTVKEKPIEQNHLMLAFPVFNYHDPRRYQLLILNGILGGGVASRLFQELREKRGLCYTVYSYVSDYRDGGIMEIYTALNQSTEEEALSAICAEVNKMMTEGPTPEELERVREQAKASVVMGLESIQAKMSHLATGTLLFNRVRTVEEIIAEYDAITLEDLKALAKEIFDFSKISLSAVGRVRTPEDYQKMLTAPAQDA